ncbi:flagellar assembly peptidoglycan hydrolase FlgJ [Paraglaciecola hydrolytica]|uniref:Peptidoglycan hydrolase FlgJ n=1 Tax=Paraglaciecola hydrolytica TaxID=1799789 RepID=A0A148KNK6_9ALTE|nr:flagellar assembly peptidoglycan hydrolase FlgJ [Paraglaciecola hydrolytica]KXI27892.1 glucosaminidase [Paraglaciecola hydrolytica]
MELSSSNMQNQLELSRNTNDIQGLDTLRRAAQSGDQGALVEAAKQFEGIFLQMMLKSMRKAQDVLADEESPFNSEQVKFYRDMHDQQLATDLATNGSVGLADIIVKQLGQLADGYTPASIIRNDGNLSVLNQHRIKSIQQAQDAVLGQPNYKASSFETPQQFLETLYPQAKQAAEQLGLDPKALLAQAAVETGWGKYLIHNAQGQNSHNLFGVKADKSWTGNKTLIDSIEFEQGIAKTAKSPFRAYDSFGDALQDYVDFVKQNPRYQDAINNTEQAPRYFAELQQAGYATDPEYANKVVSVLNGDIMQAFKP